MNPGLPSSSSSSSRPGAFSLVELLVVMGVIAALSALAAPAINAIKGGNEVSKAAYEVAGALEQARTYAIAKNTYVLVGFQDADATTPTTETQVNGTGRLALSIIASQDGSRNYASTSATFTQVSKLLRLENVRIGDAISNNPNREPVDLADVTNSPGFTYPLTGSQYTFRKVIEFTPQGNARLQSATPETSLPRGILLRIEPTHGNLISQNSQNFAQIQVDSLTGSVRVSRP